MYPCGRNLSLGRTHTEEINKKMKKRQWFVRLYKTQKLMQKRKNIRNNREKKEHFLKCEIEKNMDGLQSLNKSKGGQKTEIH